MDVSQPAPTGSVSGAAARGGAWVFGSRLADHGLVFLARLLVARMLGPDEIGLYGVALLVITVVETLTEPGLTSALVWRHRFDQRQLDAAWTVSVLRGLLLAGAVALLAGPIADFFDSPDAEPLVRAMALVVLLHGLVSPGIVVLERDLRFRAIAALRLLRAGVLFTSTVVIVTVTDSVWAIVAGSVLAEAVYVVATFLAKRLPLRLSLQWSALRELLTYGRWVTGSSIAVFLLLYLDDVVVGRVLGVAALAAYQLAYQIAGLPATEVSLVLNQITFAPFVRLREQRGALARAFLQAYEVTALITVPLAALVALEAQQIVDVFLGPGWQAAVAPMRILAVWGVVRALGAVTTPLLRAVGQPRTVAGFHWAMLAGTAVALVPATRWWGLSGAAAAVLVPNLLIHWFRYPVVVRPIGKRPRDLYARLLPSVGAAVAMLGLLMMGRLLLPVDEANTGATLLRMIVEVVVGGAAYVGVLGVLSWAGLSASLDTCWRLVAKVRRGA